MCVKRICLVLTGAGMATSSDLTPREEEVLRLVLAGRTNRAFAAQISLSGKTVQFHLNKISTQTGAQTRLMERTWVFSKGQPQKLGKFLAISG
jgi:DNA-binding CsgD family transcriptional regulator